MAEKEPLDQKLKKISDWLNRNFLKIILIALLLGWYSMFLVKEINLTSADLGRHLKNGEIFLAEGKILKTNFYSFTHPDFPFINHHWGAGTLFYLAYKFFGFVGVHLFFILISLSAFLIFFFLAKNVSGWLWASWASLLTIPLIAERVEVRPEAFSYLFGAVFLSILWHWQKGKIKSYWLSALPIIMLIWVNCHIYFFIGLFLIGLFGLEEILMKTNWYPKITGRKKIESSSNLKTIFLAGFFSTLASLANPYGLSGLLYPFNIFQNYGYRVVENQSVWFLLRLGFVKNPNYLHFIIVAFFVLFGAAALAFFNRKKFPLPPFLAALAFMVLSAMAIRNFTQFAFFALPVLAYFGYQIFNFIKIDKNIEKMILVFFSLAIFCFTYWTHQQKLAVTYEMGNPGLIPGIEKGAEFFKKNNLSGPIMNNYDIGSYLIFYLFPKEKVFTDNRPEAYPSSFFEQVYVPMQENEEIWKQVDEKYNFNAIFFYLQDATPWGQNFLLSRAKDPDWSIVFADQFSIIMLRKNEKNEAIIKQFEIPKENISVR